jgi:hypothetical protein
MSALDQERRGGEPGSSGPVKAYEERHGQRQKAVRGLDRQHQILANARLAVFAAGAVMAWMAWINHRFSGWWILVPVVVFTVLTATHDRVLRRRSRARRAIAFYAGGLDRLAHRWMESPDQGAEFRDANHPYEKDLDIFGPGSLFQLLCTCRTRIGKSVLAAWLKVPGVAAEIGQRQEAIAELRPRLDLRESLALLGDEVAEGVDPEVLEGWSGSPSLLQEGTERILLFVSVVFTVATLVGWLAGPLGLGPVLLALILQGVLTGRLRGRVHQVLEAVEEPGRELFLLAAVLKRLESERYESRLLVTRHQELHRSGKAPHEAIAGLARLVERLDWRGNKFFIPLALALAWSSHHAFALESWRRRHGQDVSLWLKVVGEMEALGALAGYAFEHPDDPFPVVEPQGELILEGHGLGHPLLPEAACVRNDLTLGGELRLVMISGSNMSGKSTLLRTVGVNVVLALAGAPVRAHSMRLTPLALGASLQINDSLQGGQSRFYAEIMRLRQIMDLAGGQPPLLFLLDEILHGTNSHDRRIGAEAVVRGLVERDAMGLVTTHDLALAQVATDLKPRAANIHFQDHLEDGRMVFDYRIHPGVVTRSNALDLMRSIGLKV